MFDHVSVPDVARVARRTMVTALVIGLVALGVALVLGYPLVGVGACVGIGLGMLNFRLITASVIKVGRRAGANRRRPLAMNTLSRLGAISAVTLGLLFLSFPLGFGVLGGLAVFQVALLSNTARAMLAGAADAVAGAEGGSTDRAIDTTVHVPGDD